MRTCYNPLCHNPVKSGKYCQVECYVFFPLAAVKICEVKRLIPSVENVKKVLSQVVVKHTHLDSMADELGVSRETLKKLCRNFGVPFRSN